MEANSTNEIIKDRRGKAGGAPPKNKNAVKHGLYTLIAQRRHGNVDRRTAFGRAFEARRKEYVQDLGGDLSVMQIAIVEDTIWSGFYVSTIDNHLAGLKHLVRKGKAHPLLEIRVRLAAHRRENLKTLGLKRVAKPAQSLEDVIAEYDNRDSDTTAQDAPGPTNGE